MQIHNVSRMQLGKDSTHAKHGVLNQIAAQIFLQGKTVSVPPSNYADKQ
jgi:hypothetical protein